MRWALLAAPSKTEREGDIMKKFTVVMVAAVVCAAIGATAYVSAQDAPKGEKGIIVGEVISVVDYAMYGRHGEEHAASGQNQAENGMPLAILEDETNEVWLACYRNPAPASALESANEVLKEYVGKKVTIQGLKYKADGVNLVRIAVATEY
jgi:hypothetical protein